MDLHIKHSRVCVCVFDLPLFCCFYSLFVIIKDILYGGRYLEHFIEFVEFTCPGNINFTGIRLCILVLYKWVSALLMTLMIYVSCALGLNLHPQNK